MNEALNALVEMVIQHCACEDGEYFSSLLTSDANALRALGAAGIMDIQDCGMRVVYGRFKENTL
jgi:hypothetical protein